MNGSRSGDGHYTRRPRTREFFGLVHQILPLGSGAVQSTDAIQVDGQSDFISWGRAATYQDGQIKIRFERVPGRYDASRPYFISGLGSGRFPNYYAQPLTIVRGTTYTLWADDRRLVAGTTNIRVLHIGQKSFDRPFEAARLYTWAEPDRLIADFTAQDPIGAIASGDSLQYPVLVSSEYDFDIQKIVVLLDGPCLIDIETTGKALRWFNRACHSDLLGASGYNAAAVSGEWPFRLPSPVMVPASGVILVTVTDLTVSPTYPNRVQVMFDGIKLAPARGLPISEAHLPMLQGARR